MAAAGFSSVLSPAMVDVGNMKPIDFAKRVCQEVSQEVRSWCDIIGPEEMQSVEIRIKLGLKKALQYLNFISAVETNRELLFANCVSLGIKDDAQKSLICLHSLALAGMGNCGEKALAASSKISPYYRVAMITSQNLEIKTKNHGFCLMLQSDDDKTAVTELLATKALTLKLLEGLPESVIVVDPFFGIAFPSSELKTTGKPLSDYLEKEMLSLEKPMCKVWDIESEEFFREIKQPAEKNYAQVKAQLRFTIHEKDANYDKYKVMMDVSTVYLKYISSSIASEEITWKLDRKKLVLHTTLGSAKATNLKQGLKESYGIVVRQAPVAGADLNYCLIIDDIDDIDRRATVAVPLLLRGLLENPTID